MKMSIAIPLKAPSVLTCFGMSGSGKTMLCSRLIKNANQIYERPVKHIIYCYLAYQELYQDLENSLDNITFHHGLPSQKLFDDLVKQDPSGHYLLILDDLQSSKLMDSREILELVCVKSHHSNISTIIILQNIYSGGRFAKTISLQSHYLLSLQSPRDASQLSKISYQVFGKGMSELIPEVFTKITSEDRYGYLLIDLTPHTERHLRLRTNIFPGEIMKVYKPTMS